MVCDSGRGVVVAVLFRGIQPHVSPAAAKRALFVGGLIMLAVAGYVLAAPSTGEALPPPPPCVPDTMEHYIGPTCTIGDKSFSDFQYGSSARGGAVAVPSSGVLVTPLATPGNPGFTFGGPWAAASDRPAGDPPRATSSDIFFDVRTISGAALIEDASLESVQSGTGGYGAGASAILCLDSAFPCSGCSARASCAADESHRFTEHNHSREAAGQRIADSRYSPYTARKTSQISPSVTRAFTASTIAGMVLPPSSVTRRSASRARRAAP